MRFQIAVLGLSVLLASGCRRGVPPTNEVVAPRADRLSLDPADSAWKDAPEHTAKLVLQDLVDPRLMQPSTQEVRVRSLTNGSDIAFRLQWADPVLNDLPGAGRFVDGCAIQIPRTIERDAPDPQMGQQGRPVDIVFWRADWQASVNGRKDTIQSLYPHASVDHYPFAAKPLEAGSPAQQEMARRYAPAEAAGNRRAGPRQQPVEDLVAEGPGTLSPAPGGSSRGRGVRTSDGWSVVLSRKLPEGLVPKVRTQIAFAIWEGSHHEAGARKMRTGWIPLAMLEAK
jgi:hypothetical protein